MDSALLGDRRDPSHAENRRPRTARHPGSASASARNCHFIVAANRRASPDRVKSHRRFDAIVGRGDYKAGKPAPDPFLKAAELLRVEPHRCLALEDSHNGIRSASSAGIMTIMVPDLLEPTDDIRGLCRRIAVDLHEVCRLITARLG